MKALDIIQGFWFLLCGALNIFILTMWIKGDVSMLAALAMCFLTAVCIAVVYVTSMLALGWLFNKLKDNK